jgi:hypothetical protein
MADQRGAPDDDTVRSDTVQDSEDEPFTIEQQPTGAENVKGGGEWPDPDAAPEGSAPGTDPAEGDAIDARRRRAVVEDGAEHLKDVLEADPVRGGSKATPD